MGRNTPGILCQIFPADPMTDAGAKRYLFNLYNMMFTIVLLEANDNVFCKADKLYTV